MKGMKSSGCDSRCSTTFYDARVESAQEEQQRTRKAESEYLTANFGMLGRVILELISHSPAQAPLVWLADA